MISVTPLTPGFGADIGNVDLCSVSDVEFSEIYQAWLDFGVLRFRNQPLDDDKLQAFSARFGPLEEIPLGFNPPADRKKRYVTVISNIVVDGKPIGGLGSAEANWHSDMTYNEIPPPASVLLGIEIPLNGGDTWFANQYGAFEALPDDLKDRVGDLTIKHDASHTSVGSLRRGYEAFEDPREAPGAIHPIVKTHEETGRRCLYLGRREWAYIPGMSLEASEALLDEIWQYAALPSNVWCQHWQPEDLIIWDNRCVLHRRDGIDPTERRMMRRCQVLARDSVDLTARNSSRSA